MVVNASRCAQYGKWSSSCNATFHAGSREGSAPLRAQPLFVAVACLDRSNFKISDYTSLHHLAHHKTMEWLSNAAGNHKLHLALTAVASGAIAVSAVLGLQEAKRRYNVHDLKDSIPELTSPHDVGRVRRSF